MIEKITTEVRFFTFPKTSLIGEILTLECFGHKLLGFESFRFGRNTVFFRLLNADWSIYI